MSLFRLLDTQVGERDFQIPVPAAGFTPMGGFPVNQPVIPAIVNTVSVDPGASQDVSAGYSVGSVVFNSTAGALRLWQCRDNSLGAAKWIFLGTDFASGGTGPTSEETQFGGGSALIQASGLIGRQISSAGVQPGATAADNVLAAFTIPAGSFDAGLGSTTGRGVSILAQGSFGATGNNKRVKIIFNPATAVVGSTVGASGVTIADTAVVATNGGGWSLQGNVFKYGALASNTQIGLNQANLVGATSAVLLAPQLITAVESGAILVAVTGNATTAASDIVFNFLQINGLN